MGDSDRIYSDYKFRNTCYRCFRAVEIPVLSDFLYGYALFQTTDGQDFFVAVLLDNPAYDLIIDTLKNSGQMQGEPIFLQEVLALLADKPTGKKVTANLFICPKCGKKQRHFNDDNRTTAVEIPYATWNSFERLPKEEQITRIRQLAIGQANKRRGIFSRFWPSRS